MANGSTKILVARGGAIGDFILTLPVLAALRVRFPDAKISVLGYPKIAVLAVAEGLSDEVQSVESVRFTGLFADGGAWPEDISKWLGEFEIIISYLHDPQEIFRRNVAKCTPAQFITGLHRPNEISGLSGSTQLLRALEPLGIRDADPRPRLSFADDMKATSRVAIHPGSGSEKKNWGEKKWAEFLKTLDCEVLLIGGEAEGERCARLASALPPNRVEIAQNLPLVELARRMKSCAAFIGHDSGITHLAAALDLPGVVLWGETVLTTWRPQSQRMKILRNEEGLAALSVDSVRSKFLTIGAF